MDQARIYRFLDKTKKSRNKKSRKKKSTTTENPDSQSDPTTSGDCNVIEDSNKVVTEQDKVRKKVENLLKKQKMRKAMASTGLTHTQTSRRCFLTVTSMYSLRH